METCPAHIFTYPQEFPLRNKTGAKEKRKINETKKKNNPKIFESVESSVAAPVVMGANEKPQKY